jgi:hypothetical protein
MNEIGIDNFIMLEIETGDFDSLPALLDRMQYYIQKHNPKLNSRAPTEQEQLTRKRNKVLTQKKAYYHKNKEEIAARRHQYYLEHRDDIQAKRAAAKKTCGCGGRYCYSNKSIHEKSAKHQTWLKYEKSISI